MIRTIARDGLREAGQNRLLWLVAVLLLGTFLLAEFVGAVALTEHRSVQAALAGTLLRLGAVFLMALFVVTTLLREQQDRTLDLVLALSQPRSHYVLGKLATYFLLAVALAAACALPAGLYAPPDALARWAVSLACELWLVAAFGLLLAFTFRQPVAALAGLGAVYLLSRSTAALVLIVQGSPFRHTGWGHAIVDYGVTALAWILPSLHRFTDASWLAHHAGDWAGVGLVLGQTAVYAVLLAAAAAFDLYRREF